MTREEKIEWAKSLKPGDKVIEKGIVLLKVTTVKKITPTGMIRTETGNLYEPVSNCGFRKRGNFSVNLLPATDEYIEEAKRNVVAKEKELQEKKTVIAARKLLEKFSVRHDLTAETAQKIIDFLTSLESENKEKK